ncbi:MAG TPA: DUF4836 family protein [Chitinophagaceae bacterium]|nr:DUF4836 family protein [Chitinophagaceae bacterium]
MKKIFSPLRQAPVLLVVLLASCTQKQDPSYYIPRDAAVVAGINLGRITSDVNLDTLMNSPMVREIMHHMGDSASSQIIRDPSSLGVDLSGEAFLFMESDTAHGTHYVALVASLKDPAKLEAHLKANHPAGEVKTEGDGGHMYLNGKGMIGWNSHVVMLFHQMGGGDNDTVKENFLNIFQQLAGQGKSGSIATQSSFPENRGDFMLWMNVGAIYHHFANNPKLKMVSGMLRPEIYQGNYVEVEGNFQRGKILLTSTYTLNDQMAHIMGKISSRSLDPDLLKRIPSGNPDALIALSFQPNGIKDYLNLLGVEGVVDEALSQKANIGLDTALNAFKGDLILALLPKTASDTSVRWVGVLTVGDTASMARILDEVASMGMIQKQGAMTYSLATSKEGKAMTLETNSRFLVMASSKDLADQYISGTNPGFTGPIADQANGKSAVIYLDFTGMGDIMKKAQGKLPWKMHGMGKHPDLFRDLIVTSNPLSGNSETSTLTLDMTDSSTNSLQQILEAGIHAYQSHHAMADSTNQTGH